LENLRYRYKVSLSLKHPSLAAERMGEALDLIPSHSGSVGAERRNPMAERLPGLNRESFWRHSYTQPHDDELEQFLASIVDGLEGSSLFFKDFIASGGSAQLFIGLFLEQENIGIELSPDLQNRCGRLGISLGLDIYGPDPPDGAT
jgi:hypothetical protein